jgi:hypothetical protein
MALNNNSDYSNVDGGDDVDSDDGGDKVSIGNECPASINLQDVWSDYEYESEDDDSADVDSLLNSDFSIESDEEEENSDDSAVGFPGQKKGNMSD